MKCFCNKSEIIYSLIGTGTEFVSDIRSIAIKNCANSFNPSIVPKLMLQWHQSTLYLFETNNEWLKKGTMNIIISLILLEVNSIGYIFSSATFETMEKNQCNIDI